MTEPYQVIYQGDSRDMPWQAPQIQSVITDPPFGVDNLSKQAVTEAGKKYARKIANDENPEVALQLFRDVMTATMPGMLPESDIYVFTSVQVLDLWMVELKKFFPVHGFDFKALGTWEKSGPGMGDLQTWGQAMEYILYFKRGDRPARTKRQNMVFRDQQVPPGKLVHPHEKPQSLLEKLIAHSTDAGDLVYDPFGGSASLARAARTLGRSAVCIELDEENYEIAQRAYNDAAEDLFS